MKQIWHEIKIFLKMIGSGNEKILPVLLAGGLAEATLPFLGLYFSARILNQIIAGEYQACVYSVAVLLGSQLLVGLIEKACTQHVNLLYESCEQNVKQRLAGKAFEMEYQEFEKQETMDDIRRSNISSMGSGGPGWQLIELYGIIESLCSIFYALIFIVILFLQVNGGTGFFASYASTFVLLGIYALLLLASAKLGGKVQAIFNKMMVENDHVNGLTGYLIDLICDEKNAKDIRVFGLENMLEGKLEDVDSQSIGMYLEAATEAGKFLGLNSFLSQVAAAFSYVFVAAKAICGVIGFGDVLLYAGAINRAVESIMQFVPQVSQFLYRAEYLKRYHEFISRKDKNMAGTKPAFSADGIYEFEFHDVSFAYPSNTEAPESSKDASGIEKKVQDKQPDDVLSHINLKFNVGKKLAIVGRNGAGKTTLIKLLCRLYEPTGGYITLNGVDIREYRYEEYVKLFSVVFQDFKLFSLPLGENLTAGGDWDENKVRKVLEEVALTDRVKKMEKGLESQLYNNNGEGIDISGGEAQRFAIARALYKDGPFVILDEPTAALDPISEAEIYENFSQMTADKTAVYISHRMSSCKFCDNIIVLDQGRVAECGTHDELMVRGGIYNSLYETQSKYYA